MLANAISDCIEITPSDDRVDQPVTAAIPVIMLTASDEPRLAVKATGNGATALLTKPCPIETLSSVISQAIHPPAP